MSPKRQLWGHVAHPVRWLPRVWLLATVSGTAIGAENNAALDASLPNLELLEFLGSFATDEGEWIAPDSLLENEFANLLDAVAGSIAEDDSTAGQSRGIPNNATQDIDHD